MMLFLLLLLLFFHDAISFLKVDEKTLHLALTTRKSRAGGADYFVHPYRVDEVRSLACDDYEKRRQCLQIVMNCMCMSIYTLIGSSCS